MAINLEIPRKLQNVIDMAHEGAAEMLRPISRKYDLAEHAYPVELDTLADLFEGVSEANAFAFAGTDAFGGAEDTEKNRNGANMSVLLNALEISWGDVALLFRKSNVFPLYEDALKAAQIPYLTLAGKGYYDRPEVRDLLHYLRALENPLDDLALAVILHSPLFALSSETLYRLRREGKHFLETWNKEKSSTK